ncbi:MAG: hypothetical protein J6T74_08325 [Clostridia bacterium]|nr:hypothetical protein [Clostridia bacterium]
MMKAKSGLTNILRNGNESYSSAKIPRRIALWVQFPPWLLDKELANT